MYACLGGSLTAQDMSICAESPASSVNDRFLRKVSTSPTVPGVPVFSLDPLKEVVLPCCICPTLETLKESEQG